jgi:germination protein YpeB
MEVLRGTVSLTKLQQNARSGLGKEAAQLKSKPLGIEEKQMENNTPLIYDGPFSDHLEQNKPKGVSGALVTRTKANEVARNFIDNPQGWIWQVKNTGDKKGKIPAYGLSLSPANTQVSEQIIMDVSKIGGHVVYLLNTRSVGTSRISMEEAKSRALKFLKSRGLDNMEPTYMLKQNKVAVISCVYKQDDILVYLDLVKVQVALDDGQVLGYEASGYLMAHTLRKFKKPKFTSTEAKSLVTARMQVERVQLALIPTQGDKELLTYEVQGKVNGETYFVYINALTGKEEKILKVLNTPEGTLTM